MKVDISNVNEKKKNTDIKVNTNCGSLFCKENVSFNL